jgi:hypothetical protein
VTVFLRATQQTLIFISQSQAPHRSGLTDREKHLLAADGFAENSWNAGKNGPFDGVFLTRLREGIRDV